MENDDRYFRNPFPHYHPEDEGAGSGGSFLDQGRTGFSSSFLAEIRQHRDRLALLMEQKGPSAGIKSFLPSRGGLGGGAGDVYVGHGGLALTYLKMARESPDRGTKDQHSKTAIGFLKAGLGDSRLADRQFKDVGFFCGHSGLLAVALGAFADQGNEVLCDNQAAQDCLKNLRNVLTAVCGNPNSTNSKRMCNEVLYGRAGFLYSMLRAERALGGSFSADDFADVVRMILHFGREGAGAPLGGGGGRRAPLWWTWCDEEYVGAAHGVSGILYMLLRAKDHLSAKDLEHLVKPTVDHVVANLQYASGNFPAVAHGGQVGVDPAQEEVEDQLVHWCHGAPGVVYMCLEAHRVFRNPRYLDVARQCADVTWQRGLLRKGYSLCHGVAGNAYTFLAVWQATGEPEYLHRAACFAKWCFSYGEKCDRRPDSPFSLCEGLAGTVYLLTDLLMGPDQAGFPGYSD